MTMPGIGGVCTAHISIGIIGILVFISDTPQAQDGIPGMIIIRMIHTMTTTGMITAIGAIIIHLTIIIMARFTDHIHITRELSSTLQMAVQGRRIRGEDTTV